MSATRPDSTIKYYKVPDVDLTGRQTYLFKNNTEREHVFGKWQVATETNCTVIRNSWSSFKSSLPITTLEGCNYMSFVNPSFGNKIYYCKITVDSDYVNNNVSTVNYLIDWFTTDIEKYVAQDSLMTREGLTKAEYDKIVETSGNLYKACRQLPSLDDKMRSPEPLNCTDDTENPSMTLKTTGMNAEPTRDSDGNIVVNFGNNDGVNLSLTATIDASTWYGDYQAGQELEAIIFTVPALNNIDDARTNQYYEKQDKLKEADPTYQIQYLNWFQQHATALDFRRLITRIRAGSGHFAQEQVPYMIFSPKIYTYDPSSEGALSYREIVDTMTPGSSAYEAAMAKHNADQAKYNDPGTMFSPCDISSGYDEQSWISGCNTDYRYAGMFQHATVAVWDGNVDGQNTHGQNVGSHYEAAHAIVIAPHFFVQQVVDFLTNIDLTSCILGIYQMPTQMLSQMIDFRTMVMDYPTANLTAQQVADHPKLYMSPFSYFTIESSDGESRMEYKYEDCKDFGTGVSSPYYDKVLLNRNVSVSPAGIVNGAGVLGYKKVNVTNEVNPQSGQSLTAVASGGDYRNMSYANNFPMVPFTTDSYLEFLASVARQTVEADSKRNLYQRNMDIDNAKMSYGLSVVDTVTGIGSTIASGGMSLASNEISRLNQIDSAKRAGASAEQMGRINESAAISAGQSGIAGVSRTSGLLTGMARSSWEKGQFESKQFWDTMEITSAAGALGSEANLRNFGDTWYKNAKAGYAAPSYHPSTSGGVLNKLQCMGRYGLYLVKHSRSTTYQNVFKKWFKNFGYSTGLVKVPAVLRFIEDSTSTDAPHFESKQFRKKSNGSIVTYNRNVFYTQTADLILSGDVCQESIVYTKSLLNSGCLFLRPTDEELR